MPLELLGVMAGWGLVFVVLVASRPFRQRPEHWGSRPGSGRTTR